MSMPFVNERPSPNHRSRGIKRPRCIVLHADASPSVAATLDWCLKSKADLEELWWRTDPAKRPAVPWQPVSYHYVLGRTGSVYRLVSEDRAAFHAGVSEWRGETNVNGISVGVCLSNKQDGVEPFSDEQLDAGALVVADIAKRHSIPLLSITTHAEVARPLGRKRDPAPAGPFDLMDFLGRVQGSV
jgi:N-acetylmuramoyl-L-alanine amidase